MYGGPERLKTTSLLSSAPRRALFATGQCGDATQFHLLCGSFMTQNLLNSFIASGTQLLVSGAGVLVNLGKD